jgi:hypothetical protein
MPDTSPQRPLTGEEEAWVETSAQNMQRRFPAATAHTTFDDPPDGFLAALRRERP